MSYNRGRCDCFNRFKTLDSSKCLRTFLALPLRHWWSSKYPNLRSHYLSTKLLFDLIPAMTRLRVLSLSHYNNIIVLPDSLGNLTHLRYLDLSNTKIERLPDTTCKLYNLQTLLLSKCWLLKQLQEKIGNLANLRHLDISGTELKEMPVQISELKNLQTLSNFVVSKQKDGLKVSELREFPNLQGKLSISNLQNVADSSEAFQANLKKKDQIVELALKWNCNATEDSQVERLVLEQLQPSTNLKKLSIKFYGGTSFPNWLGDSCFENMVCLHIISCNHCWSLPPLGQLLNLKELIISGLESVSTIGTEFYGFSSQPFPSLEILRFEEMPEWEEWILIGGTFVEFPVLKRLLLCDCPKLKGNLPNNLPSLIELELSQCGMLNQDDAAINLNAVRPLTRLSFYSLNELTISGIPSLTSFPENALPPTLHSLTVLSCENLHFLSYESLPRYMSLEKLQMFNSCDSLTCFPLGSLPVLKSLFILGCKNLKSITVTKCASPQSLSCLQSLSIYACPNLESFPVSGSFMTLNLNSFLVSTCRKLKSLPEPINTLSGLYHFCVYGLPNLQAFTEAGLPAHLRILEMSKCGSLATSAIANWGFKGLNCLVELRLRGDALVNALMKMEVQLLPSSLVSMRISHLHYIKCLEGKWLRHLANLESVEISDCRRLESLPKEGMPYSLSVLTIKRCVLLEGSCHGNGGKVWNKISRIQCLIINDRVII